jgi:hypothetical protein
LPAARAGNIDAEFYLSKALTYCSENNGMYFRRKGKAIGLDEGLPQ